MFVDSIHVHIVYLLTAYMYMQYCLFVDSIHACVILFVESIHAHVILFVDNITVHEVLLVC